jgi:hypothetical protein
MKRTSILLLVLAFLLSSCETPQAQRQRAADNAKGIQMMVDHQAELMGFPKDRSQWTREQSIEYNQIVIAALNGWVQAGQQYNEAAPSQPSQSRPVFVPAAYPDNSGTAQFVRDPTGQGGTLYNSDGSVTHVYDATPAVQSYMPKINPYGP